MFKRMNRFWVGIALVFTLLGGLLSVANFATDAEAGPEVVGNPSGATSRVLMAPAANGTVKRIVYFSGVLTPVGLNTPIASSPQCGIGGASLYRSDVILTGTMTGTNPTGALLWQNSIDGGTTWNNVGTWTTINATVTPASQSQTVADLVASTAVAYGDCWRFQVTFGGTGSVGANLRIIGFAK